MEDDSTSKTILLWKRLTHPKQVISLPQIHALESNLKLPVDPLIVGDLNADQSWAEWDDEEVMPHCLQSQFQRRSNLVDIVDRKKKLGVKSVAPKSKRRYSTRSKPELNLSDDEKSRLISELQTKVEELSNRVMKLERAKKTVRSTKLSSSFVACSSRSKRKKIMEVPIQSQTSEPEVAQQVPDDHLDKTQDSSDSIPLINTEITDDPMDVFVTPLQSEHSNKDDANEGNPVYDTDVKDQNANEEDVDSQHNYKHNISKPFFNHQNKIFFSAVFNVDPSSNPSVEKLLPLNQDHISDRVPAIPSGLDLSKEHSSKEQESNANEEDVDSQMKVDPRSDPSVEKLLPLNQDHIIDDASERVPAPHSGLDLPKEHNFEELETNANETDVDGKMQDSLDRETASHSDIDLPIDQSSEEQQAKDTMEAAAASHSLLGFAKFAKKKVTLESATISQALSQTPPEVNFDDDTMKDQITDSRDIGAHDLDENQEEGYVDVSDSPPARERENPTLSEAEVFLVAELLSKSKTGSYELLPSMSKSEFALFPNTLSAARIRMHMEVLVSLFSQKLATTLTNQRAAFVQPWFANHLQGKLKGFKAAKMKSRVKWSEPMKQFIVGPNTEWFADIDTIYLPMISDSKHWVGLAINLGVWSVEILDPNIDLYEEDEVRRFFEPVVTILPYLIQRICDLVTVARWQ
ncbi:unnamed protein product [Arabidopsis thaliana]|uniref:(thale cress) hypothetical protein n=1 Tax=Arabidopsis thaliana TaxID=3702 RepID=A0A7G2EW74_ARATH|nr:unnamed protein product [Arabidopsis thaliana]